MNRFLFVLTVWFGLASSASLQAQELAVAFDVPAIVVAQPVNPEIVQAPLMGGQLMRLRIPVSTVIAPGYQGSIAEYLIEFDSPGQTMRVVDFWPKNETYSELEGTIDIEASKQVDEHFSFGLAAAYPTIGSANAKGDYLNHTNVQERYQRRPPMQTLTSSGTIHQGFGVFFKFRPGPVDVLEGARDVALLVEVPAEWRADMLRVKMTAVEVHNGSSYSNTRKVVASSQLWMTTHREGDGSAAAQALAYVHNERALRGLAASQQQQIAQRSTPTIFHKVGAALDVVETRIPQNYLASVIFGPASNQFNSGMQRLPVDLRVAILDYWQQRSQLLDLARPKTNGQNPSRTTESSIASTH